MAVVEFCPDRAALGVIDADHSVVLGPLALEDTALGGDVSFHAAMAVQMVGRDVQEHGDVEAGRGHQFELVGGHLEHIDAALSQRRQGQRRRAEIGAHLGALARAAQQMADKCGGGRFAVGARDADIGCLRLGAEQQFHLADDRHVGGNRFGGDGMGLRKAVGNPRAQHQG